MLISALVLSAIAGYYSILGLTTIFAAAFWPVVVMGSALEVSKVVASSWLYRNWYNASVIMRGYLTSAVVVLMLITSMGTFGYLSKAHSDQSVVSGDVIAKLELVDEKIKLSKSNIDISRKALKQLDDAVDQMMARSQTEKSVNSAIYIRKNQQKERATLMKDIEDEQKKISSLNEERIPLAAQVRKVEAEVGPIKYISAMFTDDTSQVALERAVRWVIILIVIVFDPLAIAMLIAANASLINEKVLQKRNEGSTIEVDKDSIVRF